MLKKHTACILRVALFAAFINVLAPTVSYLLAASAGKQVVEICTSFGLKKVLVDPASGHSDHGHGQSARCQFCLASQDAVAFILPPSPALSVVPKPGAPISTSATPTDVRKRWAEGRPRAPPAITA
ncbi:DUF2946 domain-containing protein [Uliginosibacterium sp. 31-16]|uniref:DUF2946 domain-containing protein n=1 Tax=Uliginosibacterium sp. 31-16 TaxID=3068315 RepID=UPI00273FBCC4|nr:DUF2946 domain-containing protein [Uliginosibacterium sp. 31-16]MDP5238197.1 DUF2946 domain-containing protein [Uliginosibacterium sp. 31-16]